MTRLRLGTFVSVLLCAAFSLNAFEYSTELNITYCTVDGKELKLNAFLPKASRDPRR